MTAPFPKVSVITICLNDAPGLRRTVNSVLAQDYPALEHVIVDGGSTDGTARLLDERRAVAAQPAVILSEPDRGISHAFNKGLLLATGDWINFLNSGDAYVRPGAVSRFAQAFPLAPVVSAFARFGLRRLPKRALGQCAPLSRRVFAAHQATFVRRDVFGVIGGFSEEYRLRMDYDFMLRALPRFRLEFIDEALVDYAEGGRSGADPWRFHREACQAQRRHLPWWPVPCAETLLRHAAKTILSGLGLRS